MIPKEDETSASEGLSGEDAELDRMWREMFGAPLPIQGSASIVRQILSDTCKARENFAHRVELPPAP